MWGLDHEGHFSTSDTTIRQSLSMNSIKRRLRGLVGTTNDVDVRQAVLADLRRIRTLVTTEMSQERCHDDSLLGRHLLFLFQKDLLPGISGKILEAKHNRDDKVPSRYSYPFRIVCWGFIITLNAAMLFYIYLFASQQSSQRQAAWFKSFLVWILFETCVVSTLTVLITHIAIPSIILKDVMKIKQRLVHSLEEHARKQSPHATVDGPTEHEEFNATEFFFVSTRIAKLRPELKQSKIVLSFSTPWPHQSYQHARAVSSQYSKKFSFVGHALSMIVIYLVNSLLTLPLTMQDILVQLVSTTGIGYLLTVCVDLYRIHPALPLVLLLTVLGSVMGLVGWPSSRSLLGPSVKPLEGIGTDPVVISGVSGTTSKADGPLQAPSAVPCTGGGALHDHETKADDGEDTEGSVIGHMVPRQPRTRRDSVKVGLSILRQLQESQGPTLPPMPERAVEGRHHLSSDDFYRDISTDDDSEEYDDMMVAFEATMCEFFTEGGEGGRADGSLICARRKAPLCDYDGNGDNEVGTEVTRQAERLV